MGVGAGVRLEDEECRGLGLPGSSPSVGELVSRDVATGTNDEPLRLTIWVNSSFPSRAAGALIVRLIGSVSCNGRSRGQAESSSRPGRCLRGRGLRGTIVSSRARRSSCSAVYDSRRARGWETTVCSDGVTYLFQRLGQVLEVGEEVGVEGKICVLVLDFNLNRFAEVHGI